MVIYYRFICILSGLPKSPPKFEKKRILPALYLESVSNPQSCVVECEKPMLGPPTIFLLLSLTGGLGDSDGCVYSNDVVT